MKRASPRVLVTFGLISVLTSALLLTMFLGFIPNRLDALVSGRAALSEAIAVSISNSRRKCIAQPRSC